MGRCYIIPPAERRCQHLWQPLFHAPTEAHSEGARVDWLFLRAEDYRLCPDCGAIGLQMSGFQRGGGHRVLPLTEQEIAERDLRARARAWNTRLRAEE